MNLIEFFDQDRDRYAALSGIELMEFGEGYAKAKMGITTHHLNGLDVVHGGAIFTLADYTFAVACNSHGAVAVSMNASITYMKAASKGMLFAEAKEISKTPKIGTYTVTVTDDSGELIAIFQGLAYRKKLRLEDLKI